ncbi:MAG TPA: type I methionyl aminopeptidase [Bacteroidetes bacterium]|nr:type I methionyl aminopeptidase [Bacteroidota bacterium]
MEKIRESCKILVETFQHIRQFIRPGVKTIEIDREVERFIRSRGGKPSFKGFHDFPGSACISIDEEVVHGIPGERRLEEGQIVGVDIGVNYRGYYSDAAFTFAVGEISPEKLKLLRVTHEALYRGIEQAKAGNRLTDISHAIQAHAEAHGFSVVRELVGHGVGLDVWEPPQVPNYGAPGRGPKLVPGMVLALEPMVNMGTYEVLTESDGWTVVTRDGKPSAHFEHTIAITEEGTEILTEGIGGDSNFRP